MKIDANDLTWIMISSALVMLMTPGLALFYGGMVRRKNVLGTIMQSFIALGVITLQWVFWGYSLSFGPDCGHVIGNLSWAGLVVDVRVCADRSLGLGYGRMAPVDGNAGFCRRVCGAYQLRHICACRSRCSGTS